MTHNQLLVKIDEEIRCAEFEEMCGDGGWSKGAKALRAIVELHKPKKELEEFCDVCWFVDNDPMFYPCPTIQAIENELL